MDPVLIDGSFGEGGGAILRQSLGLSLLTGKPFLLKDIRKGRPKPGLSFQHLHALNAAHQVCNAEVVGNHLGSTEVSFSPGPLKDVDLRVDIGTAGSVTLLLQTFLLPAFFSAKRFRLRVRGGTDVAWSIPVDYFRYVLLPHLRMFGDVDFKVLRRGYYPKGGGEVDCKFKGFFPLAKGAPRISLLDQGELFKIGGLSHASSDLQPSRVADRQAQEAFVLLSQLRKKIDIQVSYGASDSYGSGLTLWAACGGPEGLDFRNPVILGSSCLGEKHLKAEKVGELAVASLKDVLSSHAAVDEYLADQLLPFLALVGGKFRTNRITDHLRSNIYVLEQFLDVLFIVDEESGVVSCEPALLS